MIDVHEHHMPGIILNRDVGLFRLLQESYCGWTMKRPYPLPSEPPVGPLSSANDHGSWADIARFVDGSGSNAFVRNMVRALADLYGLPGTDDHGEELD